MPLTIDYIPAEITLTTFFSSPPLNISPGLQIWTRGKVWRTMQRTEH